MDFRHFFLLMCTSLLDIRCHDTDSAILEKIAAAASTCKYSRLSEACKGKDCAALSGQCHCDDECHNKPGGCCIDVDEVMNGERALVNLVGKKKITTGMPEPMATNCSMVYEKYGEGCSNYTSDECNVFFIETKTNCYCHEGCFSDGFPCCKDIYLPYKSCSTINTTKDDRGFCTGRPEDCVVQTGKEFCYCDIKCVSNESRKCCEDLDFPKNCSMIPASNKDKYGFCKGNETNKCAAKPDGEEYCYCDVECVSDEKRKCCEDIGKGCSHGNDRAHGISQNPPTGMLEFLTFLWEKYDELRRSF